MINEQLIRDHRQDRKHKQDYLGVRKSCTKGKWIVEISYERKNIYLGTYLKLSDAIQVYDDKVIELKGKNAITNKYLIENGILDMPSHDNDYIPSKVVSLNGEIWKDIKDYEGYYQVSNLGRIKSLYHHEKILKPKINIDGYRVVSLYKIKKHRQFFIHRLIAHAFILNPENLPCINHKDGGKLNNSLENLEWVTVLQNNVHALKTGLKKMPKGEDCTVAKLTEEKVKQIRKLYIPNEFSVDKLSKMFAVSIGAIGHIIKRRTWKHVI